METLDRALVNNEIIQMRPVARQAKVSVLRRHVHKIKQLHKRHKKHPKDEKKIERLAAEVQEIKKILLNAISKYAMITPVKTCEKRMADVNASLTIRVLSRLSSENVIVQKMNELKKKYKNWADVPLILEGARRYKSRTKLKKHKNTGMDSQDIGDVEITDNSDAMSDDEEECEFLESENKTDEEDESHSLSPQSSGSNAEHTQDNPQLKKEKTLEKKNKPKATTAVVRRLATLEDLESLVADSDKVDPTDGGTARKDSFFLSSQGEEVESEDESDSSESEQSDGEQGEAKFSRVYHNRNKSDRGGQPTSQKHIASLNSNSKKMPAKRRNGIAESREMKRFKTPNFNKKGNRNPERSRVDPSPKPDEKLHPSWEAKRKLKEAIQIGKPQQNKKILFD